MKQMMQRLICWLGWCRKSEVGRMRGYDDLSIDGRSFATPHRCPHCKMGFYVRHDGQRIPNPFRGGLL